jgi:hypothetical protein
MALTPVKHDGFHHSKWWPLCVMFFLFVGLAASVFMRENFAADLRAVARSNVDYLMLCDLGRAKTGESCRVIDRKEPGLQMALTNLYNAGNELPPGHATAEREMMLRIGQGDAASKQYVGCYRVVRYVGVQGIYIQGVTTDPSCARIEKYLTGSVLVAPDTFGHDAI